MVERERHNTILRILAQDRFATISDMVRLLGISEATIRRDLSKLESQGSIRRFRGGAELADTSASSDGQRPSLSAQSLENRKGIMAETKRMIAKSAVSLIGEGETVIIDGGSTTFYMAEFLRSARLRIITNSFAIASTLLNAGGNTVILAGGVLYPDSQMILDPFESGFYRNYSAGKVFMGVEGIDADGATNSDTQLIKVEREMLERGGDLILLADSCKFSKRGALFLCGFDRIHTIITDNGIAPETADMIRAKGAHLVVV